MAHSDAFDGSWAADADVAPARSRPTAHAVRSTYHGFRLAGLTAVEAGNLTAHLNGLRMLDRGWTPDEIERLLFLRVLVERRRISG